MTKEIKLLQIIIFHDLINQDNISIVEWIVMCILKLDYNKVQGKCKVLDSRITRLTKKDRVKYVDLIIKYEEYEIILELNRNFEGNIIRNILFGMTRLISYYKKRKYKNKKIYQRNYYKKEKKVIIVNLNWEKVDIINKKLIKSIEKLHGKIWENILLIKIINAPLDKYANMPYNKIKKRERFYKLLTINKINELNMIMKDEPLIEEYGNKLLEYSKEEKYIKEEEKMVEAINEYFLEQEAYNAGEKIGIEKNQNNIVLNMYEEKFDLKSISRITKLSIDKIKEIINSKKN